MRIYKTVVTSHVHVYVEHCAMYCKGPCGFHFVWCKVLYTQYSDICPPEAALFSLKNNYFGQVVLCCFCLLLCCDGFVSISWMIKVMYILYLVFVVFGS